MEWAYTIEVFRESGQPFDTWPGLPLPYSLNEGKVFAHNDCEVEVLQVVKQALGGDPPLGEPGHVKARLVHDFIEERLLEKIRSELVRLGAGEEPGLGDAIKVSRRERGRVDLQDVLSRPEEDFLWVGPGAEALARLQRLSDKAGPAAVRSEFQD